MGTRERLALLFVCAIGALSITAGIVKVVFLIGGIGADPTTSGKYNAIVFYTTEAEVSVAFIALCLPALRVLFRGTRPLNGTQQIGTNEISLSSPHELKSS
jgi:hypothetical protein